MVPVEVVWFATWTALPEVEVPEGVRRSLTPKVPVPPTSEP